MTWQLAEKMTGWFIRRGFLAQDDYEVYVYCIDSLLGKVFFYLTLFLVAGWFWHFACHHLVLSRVYAISVTQQGATMPKRI